MDPAAVQALVKIASCLEQSLLNQAQLLRELRGLREPLVAMADALHDSLEGGQQLIKLTDDVAQAVAEVAHNIVTRGGG